VAQLQISMEGWQILVHSLHQPRVNRHRNIWSVQPGFKIAVVISRLGVKNRPLHVRIHHRSKRPAIFAQRREERLHHFLSVFTRWRRAMKRKRSLVELYSLAITQRDRR